MNARTLYRRKLKEFLLLNGFSSEDAVCASQAPFVITDKIIELIKVQKTAEIKKLLESFQNSKMT